MPCAAPDADHAASSWGFAIGSVLFAVAAVLARRTREYDSRSAGALAA